MKYLVMVGHGLFPPGLHDAVKMFSSDTKDLIHCNLENGMDNDVYVDNLRKKLSIVDVSKDEIILLSDMAGGSPLTNALMVLDEIKMLDRSVVYTGMNLPLAINAVMYKDDTKLEDMDEVILQGTSSCRFTMKSTENEEI